MTPRTFERPQASALIEFVSPPWVLPLNSRPYSTFFCAVRHGNSASRAIMKPIRERASNGVVPRTSVFPSVASTNPASALSRVVFPQPLLPTKLTNCPRGMVRSRLSTTVFVDPSGEGKDIVSPSSCTAGVITLVSMMIPVIVEPAAATEGGSARRSS